VIGGASDFDATHADQLGQLFEWGLVPAAGGLGATLIDGGTDAGVMAVLGQASAASQADAKLVGVAPAGRITFPGDDPARPSGNQFLEPHHSAFVLANSSRWGGETPLLFAVAAAVAGSKPIVAVLAGGGDLAREEVHTAVSRRIPILVIEGTGGTADELATAVRSTENPRPDDPYLDVRLAADLTFVALASQPEDIGHLLRGFLGPDEVLREAIRLQKLTSAAAKRQQKDFFRLQVFILALGLLVTTLIVIQAEYDKFDVLTSAPPEVKTGLYALIILVPLLVTAFTALQGRFRPGTRWLLLRGASETIKRDIYRYRTRSGMYSPAETRTTSAAVKLAEAVGSTLGSLMRTDVSQLGFKPPPAVEDAKLTPLTGRAYVDDRITDQIKYYMDTADKLVIRARLWRMLAIAAGLAGSFLAAIGLQIWVAITSTLVGIFTTLVESRQLEVSSQFYNQAAADLTAIRAWWNALPESKRETQATIDRLVERAERVMRAEHVGWVQEMQDAMTQFRLEQASDDGGPAPASGAQSRTASAGLTPVGGPETTNASTANVTATSAGTGVATRSDSRGRSRPQAKPARSSSGAPVPTTPPSDATDHLTETSESEVASAAEASLDASRASEPGASSRPTEDSGRR
jgi:hypothetical protein